MIYSITVYHYIIITLYTAKILYLYIKYLKQPKHTTYI